MSRTELPDVVFVLVRTPIREVYGGEKSTIATALALAERGYRTHFVITAQDDLARELDAAGLPYDVVPVGDPLADVRAASWRVRLQRLSDVVRVSRAIARRRTRSGPVIVHAAGIPGVVCSWLGAKFSGGKLVYHCRTGSRVGKTRTLDEITMLLADRTIAVSGSLRDELVGTGHHALRAVLARRVVPVYNGFDFARIDAFLAGRSPEDCRGQVGPEPERVAVVFVGGIFVDKGQLAFIERVLPAVVARVPQVLVTCIGGVKDEKYLRACETAIARAGLENNVRFLGYRPQEEVFAHYRASDIAVLPSTREGLPRCAVEAQAFGLPIVATAVVGTVEAVRDRETGYLVALDQLEDMAEHVIRLAHDGGLRRQVGAAGARHVRSQFSLERNADEIAAVYASLGV